MGDFNLGTLTAILTAVDKVTPVVENIDRNVEGASKKMESGFAAVGKAVPWAIVATGAKQVIDVLGELVAAADKIDEFRGRLNVTAESVQRLEAIAEGTDTAMNALVGGVQELQKRLGEGKLDDVLKKLNIEVDEFARLDGVSQYAMVAEALGRIEDPSTRAAVAFDALGGKSRLLAGSFQQGVTDMDRWVAMSDQTVSAVDLVDNLFTNAKTSVSNFGAEVLANILQLRTFMEVVDYFGKAELPGVGPSGAGPKAAGPLTMSEDEYERINKALDKTQEKLQRIATKDAADWRRETERTKQVVDDFAADVAWDELRARHGDMLDLAKKTSEEIANEIAQWTEVGDVIRIGPLVHTENMLLTLEAFKPALEDAKPAAEGLGDVLKRSLSDSLASLPDLLVASFTGGGGLSGALKGFGAQAGGDLGEILGKSLADKIGGSLGKFLGGFGGPVGSLLGAGAGSLLGKLFGGGEGKQVNDMRDKFVAAAGGIHELNVKAQAAGLTLDRLLNAKKVGDFEAAVAQLTGAFDAKQQKIALARQAMDEFGITIEEAGAAFKQAEMDGTAVSLTEKIEALLDAGVSLDTIIAKAGDNIADFITRSIEMGTTVPKEWEPIVQKMIDQGTLIDSTGRKYEDMSEIPWAETLNDKIGAVMDKLLLLIERILDVPDALGRIPRDVDINFNGRRSGDWPDGVEFDGPKLAGGGVVTRPTIAMIGEAGPEAVVPLDRAGFGGSTIVHVDARGALLGDLASQRQLASLIEDAVMSGVRSRARVGFAGYATT